MLTNSGTRYGLVAQLLHWAIAGLIIAQYVLANLAARVGAVEPRTPSVMLEQMALLARHKSLGITILALAVVRLTWRCVAPPPPLPRGMPVWQQRMATTTHLLMYALLFALPVSGWLMSSATNYPVSYFGLFTLPDLVGADRSLADDLIRLHHLLATTLFVVAVIHVAAALKHHFIDRDDVLRRMLPWQKRIS